MPNGSGLRTLLIIDDDVLLGDSIRDTFSSKSFEVLAAHSAAEGIAACRSRKIDVVILDQKLPDAEGHTLCQEILELNERTKIVFVTAYPSFENALRAIKEGAFDYLSKPFHLEQLRLTVDRCFNTLRLERAQRAQEHRLASESGGAVVRAGASLSEVMKLVDLAATSDAPVLITGETGTGKSLIARSIHFKSARRNEVITTVNCAALPESLVEAELFGHERAAFTGAANAREGVFEMADGSTLLLDEIGDMPLSLQAKLLNVLEEKTVRRLGGRLTRSVDFRLITATNTDLEEAVKRGAFRSDLFYRLNVIRIHMPPLRDHPEHIADLCSFLLAKMAAHGLGKTLPASEIAKLTEYPWPGNVRELRNVLERAVLLQKDELRPSVFLAATSVPESEQRGWATSGTRNGEPLALDEVEKQHILHVLARTAGNLTQASRIVGVSLSTLKRKVRKYRLSPTSQNEPARLKMNRRE